MDVAPTESGRQRIIDLDVVRAVALIGVVVMNFHGYLINDGDHIGSGLVARIFNPWTGPLSTRFAATFMMIAGMGVTLMTNYSRRSGDRAARRIDRWRLIRRGSLLYGFGAVVNARTSASDAKAMSRSEMESVQPPTEAPRNANKTIPILCPWNPCALLMPTSVPPRRFSCRCACLNGPVAMQV